ncbi:hypothetical protein ACH6EH_06680 [Paenibacillus sp. JSM ZJ436]|uniref:hypothetical protein n=1 Tax=Paenibacillus sp. JSM ZJ436 TaxID=3376190 RepID=UPI0037A4FBA1
MVKLMKSGSNTKTTNKETKKCIGECKRELSLLNFYNNNNPMSDGKSSMCKKCINDMIDYSDIKTIYAALRALDLPFLIDVWSGCETRGGKIFGNYLRQINSLHNYKGMTWEDSIFEEEITTNDEPEHNTINNSSISITKNKFRLTSAIIDKWGEGYSEEQYRLFEKKYIKLIRSFGEKTELHTENLLNYIRFRVQEEIATAKGSTKDAKEWAALASKAAQDAKINVSQLSKSDISGGVDVLSQLFEATETEASVIPLLPKLLEQPYDDADMIIWANINYYRILEDKSQVSYRDIWNFYDTMLEEHFAQKGFDDEQIKEYKSKRNNVFRDLAHVYIEPLYESDGD